MDIQKTDYFFTISTRVTRHSDFPEMLVLRVTATDEENFEKHSATLKALVIYIGEEGFPNEDSFHLFDVESHHTMEAYHIIQNNKQKIRDVLGIGEDGPYSDPEAFLVIEKVDVDEECRGLGLALRLMKEAKNVFGYWPNTMSILKAYPTNPDPFDKSKDATLADIRSLADYYMSDKNLGFKEIDPENELGWLVALGAEPYYLCEDGERLYFP
jgi:hypothetical protein